MILEILLKAAIFQFLKLSIYIYIYIVLPLFNLNYNAMTAKKKITECINVSNNIFLEKLYD